MRSRIRGLCVCVGENHKICFFKSILKFYNFNKKKNISLNQKSNVPNLHSPAKVVHKILQISLIFYLIEKIFKTKK